MEEKDFIFHPICVVPPERHYDSCKELKDDLVWYEKSRAYFYKHHPEFIPQKGQFEQVKLAGKKGFILLPTSLDYGVLYRGQGKYHGTCLPSLYRQELTEEKIFVEHVRIAEFRLFLEQFDVTRHFKECGYVVDHARAIDMIFHKGKIAETYNIGGFNEWKNIDIIKVVIKTVDRLLGRKEGEDMDLITYVTDRKGHDMRYAIDSRKLQKELGWEPSLQFEEGMEETVKWYLENQEWMDNVTSGDYQKYYENMYQDR